MFQLGEVWHLTRARLRAATEAMSDGRLAMPVASPIGDLVDGREGLKRLSQHAAHHLGQIVLVTQLPGYPTA
jgi:hypothetical protein